MVAYVRYVHPSQIRSLRGACSQLARRVARCEDNGRKDARRRKGVRCGAARDEGGKDVGSARRISQDLVASFMRQFRSQQLDATARCDGSLIVTRARARFAVDCVLVACPTVGPRSGCGAVSARTVVRAGGLGGRSGALGQGRGPSR